MSIVLSHIQAKQLLSLAPSVSLDLGLTTTEVTYENDFVRFPNGLDLALEQLKPMIKHERKCFLIEENAEPWEIRIFSETTGWVRSLAPTQSAPTMLVSGIPMHRIKDTDPWADTKTKIKSLGKVFGNVLDTATGLGYTAIQALPHADTVVTCELDPSALEIARFNPWSQDLFNSEKIEQKIGDSFELIDEFPDHYFSAIIHDPPTIQLGGHLYSEEFYKKCRRKLSNKGQLFHYIGDPTSGLGKKVTEGAIRRLHDAGFKQVIRHPEAFGLIAR